VLWRVRSSEVDSHVSQVYNRWLYGKPSVSRKEIAMNEKGPLIFRLGAISNWLVAIGGIISPTLVAKTFAVVPANYPFLVRIWTGMVFMFGAMFWEISRDMFGKRHLIKYAWIEKCITATSVTIGYFAGYVPGLLFMLILFTDYLWIPPFMYYDFAMQRRAEPDLNR
jgi:hypothetical protein